MELPFQTQRGREESREAGRQTKTRERKSQRGLGLAGNSTSGTVGGRHMSGDGGRKVRQGVDECLRLIKLSPSE